MDLWIYSENFKLQGIVDTASSIIWANRFRQCGDFEIYIPASKEVLSLLQVDRIVARQDSEMAGIIEKVELTSDEENGDYITATGRCMRSIFDRRIIWDQTRLDSKLEYALRRLVTEAFISPVIEARKYDKITLAESHGYTETVRAQYTGTNLLEAIEELCAAKNYGFKVLLQDGMLVVDFYKGVDRSAGQSENPRVIFSEKYDTLAGSTYTRDKAGYKSVVLVAGEGEGSGRRRVTVNRSTDQSGLQRREMYADARDLSTNEGEIAEDEYLAQLSERGSTKMSEAAEIVSMSGNLETMQTYIYGVDYDLGDIVTTENKYGVQADTQVLEVVETWDENGYSCVPTFGGYKQAQTNTVALLAADASALYDNDGNDLRAKA